MTKTQSMYSSVLAELLNIQSVCDLSESARKSINADELKKHIDNDPLLVPIVGDFSAGKSTLLNNCIGRENFLKVDMRPETAIPAELYFSQSEYIESVDENGVATRIANPEFAPQNCHHLKYFINSEFLQKVQPLTLVDMPGFNSPHDFHNKAIYSYINSGAHYIVLIACESGTLKTDIKNNIETLVSNLDSIKRSCSFFLTKCDKKPESEIQKIANEIKEQLKYIVEDAKIMCVSKNNITPFVDFATGLNAEEIFENYYKQSVEISLSQAKDCVDTKIKGLKNDVEQCKKTIDEIKNSQQSLLQEKQRIENENFDSASKAEEILQAIDKKLNLEASSMAGMAISFGASAVESRVQQIVQSVASTKVRSIVEADCENITQRLSGGMSGLNIAMKDFGQENSVGNMSSITAITSIASIGLVAIPVGGTIASTIIKIIVELLPALGKWLSSWLGGSNNDQVEAQERQRRDVKAQIKSKFPEILSSVRPQIIEALNKGYEQSIKAVAENLQKQLEAKKESIEQSIKEQTEDKEKTEQRIALYEQQMQKLDELMAKIQA